MSQQQNPMSRLITPLLIGCVVFLGINLFFKPDPAEQVSTADVQKSYEDAVAADDNAKIMEFGPSKSTVSGQTSGSSKTL